MELTSSQKNECRTPDLSVVVAVCNVEKFLPECLESLRIQNLDNAEFLVIDDGSTDSCGAICDRYEHLDSRFKVLHQQNKGTLIAKKRGVELARGKWCIIIDGDDFLPSSDVLATELELAEKNNADILRFDIEVLPKSPEGKRSFLQWRGDFSGTISSPHKILSNIFDLDYTISWTIWDKIYRTSVLKQTLPFIEDDIYIPCATDACHMFLICFFSNSLISLRTKPLYAYRHGVGVSTGDVTLQKYRNYAREPKLVDMFASFLRKQNKLEEYASLLNSLRQRFIETAVYRYSRIQRKDSAEGFDCLIDNNPIENVIDALYVRYRNRVSELAEKIHGSRAMQNNPHEIKTIAICYEAYNIGGVQRVISIHLPMFLSLGFKVVLITDRTDEREFPVPEGVARVILPGTYEKGRALALVETIKNYKIDLILHNSSSANFLLFDLILIKSLGCSVIILSHELTTQPLLYTSVSFGSKPAVFRLADAVVLLSSMEQNFYKKFGVSAHYIPNPINVGNSFSKEYCPSQKTNGLRSVLWIGRLDNSQKNFLEALDILNNVVHDVADVVCYVVARGKPADFELVLNYIKKNKLENRIYLIEASLEPEKYYRMADVILMTSSYESFSMVIAESKSFGIPLVMYELPYLELLKDKKGFISVPRHDKKAASSKIIQLLLDDELRGKLAQEARLSLEDFINNTPDQSTCWKNIIEEISQVRAPEAELCDSDRDQQELNFLFWNASTSFAQEGFNRKVRDINRLKREKENLLREKANLSREKADLLCKYEKQSKEIKKLSQTKSLVEKKLGGSLSREKSLKQSLSFRIGRGITWFPRKIRGGFRCFKQHGMVYTINRFFWHLFHLR